MVICIYSLVFNKFSNSLRCVLNGGATCAMVHEYMLLDVCWCVLYTLQCECCVVVRAVYIAV